MSVSDLLSTYPSPNSTLTLTCNPVDFCWIKGGAGAQLRYVRIQISCGLKPYGASFISRFLTVTKKREIEYLEGSVVSWFLLAFSDHRKSRNILENSQDSQVTIF